MPTARKTAVTILWLGPTLLFAYILTVGSLLAGHASWQAIIGPSNDWLFGAVGFAIIIAAWAIVIAKIVKSSKNREFRDMQFLPGLSKALGTGVIIVAPAIVFSFIFG